MILRALHTLLLLFATVFSAVAQMPCTGSAVTAQQVAERPIDEWFRVSEIDGDTFARMVGRSYKEECTMPVSELRHLSILHYDFEGEIRRGEIVCNVKIADDLRYIFRRLYEARYPLTSVRLIDDFDGDDIRSMEADNTSSFNFRRVAGSTRLSKHSRGMAVDINPLRNPYVRRTQSGHTIIQPAAAAPYVDRTRNFRGRIDTSDLCYKLFRERGFTWGGAWRSAKDYQHFEKAE